MDTQDSEEDDGKMECEQILQDEATSPDSPSTPLQSDQTVVLKQFRDKAPRERRNKRLRRDEATSPAPSCTSLQSDQSMDRPVKFKETTQNIRLRPDKATSPAPSCTSLQSDQSMDRPVQFKERTPDISTLSATLLTEDHYRCSVCTEVFKNPVSIPCGHSYCKHCIEIYWSKPTQAECYACPQCRKRFRDRPVLNVNVALAKVIDELQQAGFSPALPAHCYAGPEDVSCDICTDMKLKAVKSCLTCCVSYCETHVRQHYTVPALQRHNLVEPCSLSWDNETTGTSIAVKRFQEDNKVFAATVTKLKSILKEKDAQAKRLCKGFEVHCKDFPSDIIEVSALSHPLCLGMLYGPENDYYSQSKT
nr:nuclear factor 7, ovary-like isoform X2 [Misgurnus anguillicaudatus]